MSEFSESYHLESNEHSDGIDLLRRSGNPGFVFPPRNGWVAVVPSGGEYGEPNRALIEAAPGILLYYLNAVDHGWVLDVHSGGFQMSHYECWWADEDWSDDVKVRDEGLDVDLLVRLASRQGADRDTAGNELDRLLSPPSQDWLIELLESNHLQNPGHLVARLLGLANVSWVSGKYLELDRMEGRIEDDATWVD